ncbi:fibronectin type III domain-containing protein [Embleya sp. NPDC050493]|uniref:fibronectin type III domain-containing protein n=1 Tax=Embleya sp. NPDC050493 TaxID=3363989 RepID=UPI00378C4017
MSQRSAPDSPTPSSAEEPDPERRSAVPHGGRLSRIPGLSRLRLNRNRPTAIVAIGAAVSVVAASVVVGIGAAGADSDLSDVGAWLPSGGKNLVVHVNGLTGRVDARITLPGGQDPTTLQVSTDGKTVLVLNQRTGQLNQIDPRQLTVAQSSPDGTPNQDIATGGGNAWRITPGKGEVQRIDPRPTTDAANALGSFATIGPPIVFQDAQGAPIPLGRTQADSDGTLWVPLSATGEVVPVRGSDRGAPIKVAEPGHQLLLTLVKAAPPSNEGGQKSGADRVLVTDVSAGKAMTLSQTAVASTFKLPTDATKGAPDKFLVPGVNEGAIVPFLASDTGSLILVDINSGSVQATPIQTGKHTYGSPSVLGAKVYVPDHDTGALLVYNTVQAKFEEPIKVTGVKGKLETYVNNGLLWVNDQNNAEAAVVDVQGRIHRIGKDGEPGADGVPGDQSTPTPSKAPGTGATTAPPTTAPPTQPPSEDQQLPGGGEAPPQDVPDDDPVPPFPGDDAPKPVPRPSATGDPQAPVPLPTDTAPNDPIEVPKPPSSRPTTPGTGTPTASATGSAPATSGPTGTASPTDTGKPPATTTPSTPASTPPSTTPPEMKAPGTPKATSSQGKITLTFTPSDGAKPTRYTLGNVTAGLSVTPDSIGPGGTMKFTVSGGECGKEYKFYVSAEYAGRKTMNSGWSQPIQPCVKPPQPAGVSVALATGGHGATLKWTVPKGTDAKTTYQVKVGTRAPVTVSTTTYVVKDLKNSNKYPVTITAKNAAGSGSATTTIDLTPPPRTYKVGPNRSNSIGIGIHAGPRIDAATRRGEIGANYTGNITVQCQVKGENVTRTATNVRSAIWDRVVYTGPGKDATGYVSDLYIRTPRADQGTFSPPLWECE